MMDEDVYTLPIPQLIKEYGEDKPRDEIISAILAIAEDEIVEWINDHFTLKENREAQP